MHIIHGPELLRDSSIVSAARADDLIFSIPTLSAANSVTASAALATDYAEHEERRHGERGDKRGESSDRITGRAHTERALFIVAHFVSRDVASTNPPYIFEPSLQCHLLLYQAMFLYQGS